jgi:hypothetical protein
MSETDIAIEKAKGEIIRVITDNKRKVALAILQYVVLATPVDTGRARANWLVGINGPIRSANENSFDKSGGSTITQGINKVNSVKEETIYISNNLPYIGRLNDGHSKQAPIAYVQNSVELAKNVK